MLITVNGEPMRLEDESQLSELVARVTARDEPKGVAVAVDGHVVPRGDWPTTPLREGARVEILHATAGG